VLKRIGYLISTLPLIFAVPALPQTPARPAARPAASATPRLPGGKPNLNGIWQVMNSANWELEDHSAQTGPVVQMGALYSEPAGLGVIEGGTIPYKPEALAKKKENFANRVKLDPETKCYLPGIPRATYMPYPFEIIQSNNDVLFAYSYDTATRMVLVAKHRPAELDTWMGTNNGRWEGDTFVVDVTGFNGRAWLDRAGDFTTDSLHVVERYTLQDANTISYEATIEDSEIYTRPWKISMLLYRHREKNLRLLDYKCVELVEEMMYGDISRK
jgi:hypothetical protein